MGENLTSIKVYLCFQVTDFHQTTE